MDFNKLARQVRRVVAERGGPEGVKADALELRTIFEGKGTTAEKLKEAAAAIKEPGAPRRDSDAPPPR